MHATMTHRERWMEGGRERGPTLAVDASRRRSIRAVWRAAHAIEEVGLLPLAVEPQLGALTRRHCHGLASRQLDLRPVRRDWAHVPLESVFGKCVRRDRCVDTLMPMRRIFLGVVLQVEHEARDNDARTCDNNARTHAHTHTPTHPRIAHTRIRTRTRTHTHTHTHMYTTRTHVHTHRAGGVSDQVTWQEDI